ncbi:phage major tail protein, TP901-1 family [Streptococcus dysgalactiae]|uniref:Major tail protein n=1 Tax=Streptococcus dysgalactiae subsp. equisimilis TaxID=119602 RepID=A0A9X8SYE7_STREQ|nr:phage major tail protein, TP901-1 family [Streptococcus dysgalactiae]SQF66352.1 Major tail protein [Streptococcus dysgalactiae subsp. equisimilis]VEF04338.1 Major tail protein [Streptococcus dysgalactiae subsp. equisimilis]
MVASDSEQTATLEAKQGIHSILLFRLLEKASDNAAAKLAFQTEHEVGKSRDIDGKKTKDGVIQSLGALEYDFKATSILAKGDKLAGDLEKAMEEGKVIEIWDVDSEEASKDSSNSGKYPATYYQGYISSFNAKKNAEENIEIEMEFAINGVGQRGFATLTEAQKLAVQYKFTDTTENKKKGENFEM